MASTFHISFSLTSSLVFLPDRECSSLNENRCRRKRDDATQPCWHNSIEIVRSSPKTDVFEKGATLISGADSQPCSTHVWISRLFPGRFAGPPGTGKTAMALAIAQELGPKVPMCLSMSLSKRAASSYLE